MEKIKIKFLETVCGPTMYFKRGQIGMLTKDVAASLVASGHAEYADAPQVETAEAKAPATAKKATVKRGKK